ncbi:MAG TPA: ADP-forming succinate--CoA ligase subunit beta [Dehalococcoidia bacterium]|nr:ADP-forming succinate--CoA ligase subunit beta [Dehalococcoidia bacterium]
MKVHEFQAKQILAEFGVPVPKGRVARTPAEAKAIADELGGRVVVKAQIHAGGRGKGGGVKLANSAQEAEQVASQILGMQLVTHQTGPEGQKVKSVLVEEQMQVARELYLAVLIDGAAGRPVMMASAAGGMEIEEVAAKTPEAIHRVSIDPVAGFQPHLARELCFALDLTGDLMRPALQLMTALYDAFIAKDASLAEINPMVVTADGRVLALDAKMNFDDNALFRHPEIEALRDKDEEDPSEVEAAEKGISNFIKLDGDIGCLVNGAGLAMATMDSIKLAGGEPANFLDIATANDVQKVVDALLIISRDPNVKAILVNIFGGMARVDVIAEGIIQAQRQMAKAVPVVARLAGTNVEEGERLLRESGLPVIRAEELGDAARKAVEAARAAA